MMSFSFTDPNWRPSYPEDLTTLASNSNQHWYNAVTNEGALTVLQNSQYPDSFALSKTALDRLHVGLQDEKITAGYVVFSYWKGGKRMVLKDIPVLEVVSSLEGIAPRNGRFGEYWWFGGNGKPQEPRPLRDHEMPY
jgi:hypothetical protein